MKLAILDDQNKVIALVTTALEHYDFNYEQVRDDLVKYINEDMNRIEALEEIKRRHD